MAIKAKRLPSKYTEGLDHLHAKTVLAERLKVDWLRVDVEKTLFCWVGNFIPDIAVYDEDGIAGIYEVVSTHDVDLRKMNKIWTYAHDCRRPIFLKTIFVQDAIDGNEKYMLNVIL